MEPRQVLSDYETSATPRPGGYRSCPACSQRLGSALRAGMQRQVCRACGWVRHSNPAPGVVALVERDGMVLLGKRGSGSYRPGLWCLPGGFMEWAEDFLTAGRREVREETGLEIRILSTRTGMSWRATPSKCLPAPRWIPATRGDPYPWS